METQEEAEARGQQEQEHAAAVAAAGDDVDNALSAHHEVTSLETLVQRPASLAGGGNGPFSKGGHRVGPQSSLNQSSEGALPTASLYPSPRSPGGVSSFIRLAGSCAPARPQARLRAQERRGALYFVLRWCRFARAAVCCPPFPPFPRWLRLCLPPPSTMAVYLVGVRNVRVGACGFPLGMACPFALR